MRLAIAVAVLAAAVAAKPHHKPATSGWTAPTTYTTDVIISLPYADISEPAKIYFDGGNARSRIDYYGGQDSYIYRTDIGPAGVLYQVIPQITERTCVITNGTADAPIALQGILPDLSTFTQAAADYHRGVLCDVYEYTFSQGGKVNTYSFYVAQATQSPVSFHFLGYDQVFGSHYDEYDINFISWFPDTAIDASVFNPPADLVCGGFPGPGAGAAAAAKHHHTVFSLAAEVTDIPAFHAAADAHFAAFEARHGKKYAGADARAYHKSVFVNRQRYVDSMNRKGLGYKLAMNHMADWKAEDFGRIRGVVSSRQLRGPLVTTPPSGAYPDNFDLRPTGAIGVVKDQGICGSCWSFGSAESIEGNWYLKQKRANPAYKAALEPMSQQALVDCSWAYGNNGCDGGEAPRAFEWVLAHGNIPTEASYGTYEMADGVCHTQTASAGAVLTGYVNVTSGDQAALQDALFNHGPVSVAIDAAFEEFVFYSSGVYYNPKCGNTPDDLDHEVLAIGWGVDSTSGQAYFIIKNSWSQNWGDEGYVYMSMKDNNCGVATAATLPLV